MIGLARRLLEAPVELLDWWRRARDVITIDDDGWLHGRRVRRLPAHPSWYYAALATPSSYPAGIVAHYTATDPGTAETMARRRARARRSDDRAASWHITLDSRGVIWQMVPVTAGAWHCSRGRIPDSSGRLRPINRATIGIELEGHGRAFPEAQVAAACRVWSALVAAYPIPRSQAMLEHSALDPARRRDPGPVWTAKHAPRVMAAAYPARPAV